MLLAWLSIICLLSLLSIVQFRTRLYMVPCAVAVVYIFLNQYPECARRASRRKLTYEDLEDFRDADTELRKRFQVVFTRVQQAGGALCAGIVVMYGFHVLDNDQSVFEIIGVFGGLLSLYARIFSHISAFCVACLYKMKKRQQYTRTQPQGPTEHPCPDRKEPEKAKKSNEIL